MTSVVLRAARWVPLLFLAAGVPLPAAPVPILFDTDMDSDCDDAGALAMLHAMADAGEVRILATVCSARHRGSAPCVEAINRYYGRPDLPIGVPRGRDTGSKIGSKYAQTIATEFPGTLKSYDDAPAATDVYRKVLAAEPDAGVVVVTVMGGRYPEHLDPKVYGNFKTDPQATVAAVRDWPGTIWFSGLGETIHTGKGLRDLPAANPVRRVYELYLGKQPTRPSWDQVALLFAVRPDAPFWKLRTDGCNHIFENGTNQWRAEPDKDHVLVEFAPGVEARVQETIEALMVAPPAKR